MRSRGMVEGVRQRAAARSRAARRRAARGAGGDPVRALRETRERRTRRVDRSARPTERSAWLAQEHGSDFLFVTGYPMAKRPFYTHPDPGRPEYSNSFDLLFRGHRARDRRPAAAPVRRTISRRSRRAACRPSRSRRYLQAFRYGMPPHGGFAIGLERWVARLTGAPNIRETIAVPARPDTGSRRDDAVRERATASRRRPS